MKSCETRQENEPRIATRARSLLATVSARDDSTRWTIEFLIRAQSRVRAKYLADGEKYQG